MTYNTILTDRIRKVLQNRHGISEKKMFGGLSFLLNGKMFCGILQDNLVVRVNPNESGTLLKRPHVRLMDFTGRPMKGFLYVSPEGYKAEQNLSEWIDRGINFTSTLKK